MNKYFLIPIFIILPFCYGKQKANNNAQYIRSDDAEITTLVFNSSVYPDTIYKKIKLEDGAFLIKLTLSNIKLNNEATNRLKRGLDTLKQELDTTKPYVLIADSLLSPEKNYSLPKPINLAKYKIKTNIDTTINSWIREIKFNQQPEKFDLKSLLSKYQYQYVLESKFKRPEGKVFIVGTFSMSSIFFNKKRDKAFVYSAFVCGSLCGEGRNIYLAKKNGKWTIVWNKSVWVS